MKNPKELTNAWIEKRARELRLNVCYTKLGGVGGEAMKKNEETAECLEGRRGRNYEQGLDIVSGRGEEDVRKDRS